MEKYPKFKYILIRNTQNRYLKINNSGNCKLNGNCFLMWEKAFLFPGQGSQEVGMGWDLFKNKDPYFKSLIELGSDITKCNLEKLCLKGPKNQLMQARYLQPLLVAVSLGYFNILTGKNIVPDVVLGHSLGEITSLAAAKIVSPQQAIRIAAKRGELMDKVAGQIDGGMLAIMFMDIKSVEKLLEEINEPDRVVLANDNAPCQVVISGEMKLLNKISDEIIQRKMGKPINVNVVGPWHSPFLNEARDVYTKWAENITFKKPQIPVVFNALAKTQLNPATIKDIVAGQLTKPVFWRESMEMLRQSGVNTFYEIGPGKVLSGLIRVNGFKRGTSVHSINNLRTIEKITESKTEPAAIS